MLFLNRPVYITATGNGPKPHISFSPGTVLYLSSTQSQASYILENLHFEGTNSTDVGGVIYCTPGGKSVNLEVLNCEFVNNQSSPPSTATNKDGRGAAIYFVDSLPVSPSQLTIKHCVFDNNRALTALSQSNHYSQGAAVYLEGSLITVEDSQFTNNHCSANSNSAGGAIYLKANLGTATIRRCTFDSNTSYRSDFAVGSSAPSSIVYQPIANSASLLLEDSIFENNTGSSALFLANTYPYSVGAATIRNTTFVKNAGSVASAIQVYSNFGNAFLTHCTIWNNRHLPNTGSAVEVYGVGNLFTFSRSVIAENRHSSNAQANGESPDLKQYANGSTNLASAGYNFIGDASGQSSVFTAIGDQKGTSAAPLIPRLAALDNYGGPTRTCPPLPDSPLVDAIPNAANVLTTDQRGIARPQGFTADIGAIELPRLSYDVWDDQITLAADRDPSDDPDHDGMINRLEYFFGTNPMIANPAPVRFVDDGDQTTYLEVMHSATVRPVFFTRTAVETSTDLTPGSWSAPVGTAIHSPETPGSLDRIRSLYPVGQDLRRFFRVAVE